MLGTYALSGRKETEVAQVFRTWAAMSLMPPPCFIEKVQYIQGDGAQGAFTVGAVFGLLRGLTLGNGMKPRYVYPMTWQATLGCMTSGAKNISKDRAIALFPAYHRAARPYGITHHIADALLIAEYGRRLIHRELGLPV